MSTSTHNLRNLLLGSSLVLLAGCGGGGGGAPTPPPPPPTATAPIAAAAPTLTFEAVKTFRFDWTDVGDATHYKLLENPDSSSGFSQVGSDITQGTQTTSHVVPLYARLNAQYILQSCNAIGCTDASSVAISDNLVDSIGYVKASNTGARDRFGTSVALSGDGMILAIGARFEQSEATNIDGDQTDNNAIDAGAVYVFARDGGGWNQEAYVKASNTEDRANFGDSVALSVDGNTLAVGASGEDGDGTANQMASGAVYVYNRDITSTTTSFGEWGDAFRIKASTFDSRIDANDRFGSSLALSADGNTLAVGATGESSSAINTNGDGSDNGADEAGAVYVFSRDSAGSWDSVPVYVKASNSEAEDRFGRSVALSSDGNTLAVGAPGEDSQIGLTPGNNGSLEAGAVYVYSRDASGDWTDATYIKASRSVPTSIDALDQFGHAVSLSADGSTLAVGAIGESSNAVGIDGDQSDNSNGFAGAVYVFDRQSNGDWRDEPTYLKASNNPNSNTSPTFGASVALSADGDSLVVGASGENGAAVGFGGDQSDQSVSRTGAAYTFVRDGGTWSQQAYIKASNTGTTVEEFFGAAVAMSADGDTLAVGADREDSASMGVDGNQSDNTALNAGAVYVY